MTWLGLDFEDPDYFELLGIDPDVADPRQIKQAAKDALKKTGEQPGSANDVVEWRSVRNHIKKAYNCLSDETQRAGYLARLLVEAKKQKAVDPETDSQATNTNLDTVADELRNEREAESDIPMAMPIAEVVDEDAPQSVVKEVAQPPAPTIAAPAVKKPAKIRRRKQSPLPMLFFLIFLGGGGYLAYTNVIKPQLEEEAERIERARIEKESKIAEADQNTEANRLKPKRKMASKRDSKTAPKADPKRNKKSTRVVEDRSPNASANGEAATQFAARPPVNTSWADLTKAPFPVTAGFVHHMQEATFAMQRREWNYMNSHMEAAKLYTRTEQMLESWYRQHVVGNAYRAFWKKVAREAAQLKSMTEISIGEQVLVVTEAKPNELVYRHGGVQVTRGYEQLPTLIGLAIVELSRSKDVSELLRDRMTVYSVACGFNSKYDKQAEEEIAEAEAARLWVEDFRQFKPDQIADIYMPAKAKKLTAKQIKGRGLYRKYGNDIKLMQGLESLNINELRDRIRKLRNLVLRCPDEESEKATVVLQSIINLSIAIGDPDLAKELMNLKELRAKATNTYPNYLNTFEALADRKLTQPAARRLLVHVLELHKQNQGEKSEPQTAKSLRLAKLIARKFELAEELERIERDYGENSQPKSDRLGI